MSVKLLTIAVTVAVTLILAFVIPAIGIDERGRRVRLRSLQKREERVASRKRLSLGLALHEPARFGWFSSYFVLFGVTLAFAVTASILTMFAFQMDVVSWVVSALLGTAAGNWLAAVWFAAVIMRRSMSVLTLSNEVDGLRAERKRIDAEEGEILRGIASGELDAEEAQSDLDNLTERLTTIRTKWKELGGPDPYASDSRDEERAE